MAWARVNLTLESAREKDQEYTEDDARWDALLATEESQWLLEQLAAEALAQIEEGRASPMDYLVLDR